MGLCPTKNSGQRRRRARQGGTEALSELQRAAIESVATCCHDATCCQNAVVEVSPVVHARISSHWFSKSSTAGYFERNTRTQRGTRGHGVLILRPNACCMWCKSTWNTSASWCMPVLSEAVLMATCSKDADPCGEQQPQHERRA